MKIEFLSQNPHAIISKRFVLFLMRHFNDETQVFNEIINANKLIIIFLRNGSISDCTLEIGHPINKFNLDIRNTILQRSLGIVNIWLL